MKKIFYVLSILIIASMLLVACAPAATEEPVAEEPVAEEPVAEEPVAEEPAEEPAAEKVQVRWYVGLGTGTDANQVEIEQAVVDAFNASQDRIELVLEVVPYDSAKDTLATQIAAGNGPDIIGPVGWGGSNAFYGQWLDLTPYIEASGYDLGQFDPALVEMYQTEEGQVGLPFAVFPAAVFFNTTMFDEAGLNYLPAEYGEKYVMPDGTEVEWSWETLTEIAKLLTIDINGNDATSPDFDLTQIVQYGYHPVWSGNPAYMGSFWGASAIYSGETGNYVADIPAHWEAAWQWWYDGIWGDQPFIPNFDVSNSEQFGTGNTFGSGRIGMAVTQLWYTCCLGDFAGAGFEFQFGTLPTYDGVVNGRIDADTFRVWKGTKHPEEAFEVLTYLLGPAGVEPLIVGTADTPGAYGAFPALPEFQQRFIDAKTAQYPFVTSWDTMLAGLAYADVPSAEGFMPNWNEAWARMDTFYSLENTTDGLDLATEIATLEADLTAIFNK
ncbi:MAG: extracellular solute-binding protein [Anaerolineales bacterium]|nr:extracellular solute-binding protein [Anaerolineales bacterium]